MASETVLRLLFVGTRRINLSPKFDYYDAVAHVIPGTVALLIFLCLSKVLGIALPQFDMGQLSGLGIGIALAYVAGHLLQGIASQFEPLIYFLWGGAPSVRLLEKESKKFSEKQRSHIVDEFVDFFGLTEDIPAHQSDKRNYYQRLFEKCMALCNKNKLGRVDVFVAAYGFHRVTLVTFFIGFLAAAILNVLASYRHLILAKSDLSVVHFLVVALGLGTLVEFGRARKRAYIYAHEVIVMTSEFIRSTKEKGPRKSIGFE